MKKKITKIELADLTKRLVKLVKLKTKIETLNKIKKKGYWKEGKTTYVIEKREYPHDERCEGTMCYCADRAKKK